MSEPAPRNFVDWLRSLRGTRPGFRRDRHSDIPGVLASGEVNVVYQPIVSLENRRIFAYEALVRSTSPLWRDPPALFDEAIRSHCCGALGRQIREMAITECAEHPLFLNIHPNEFDESWLVQPDDPIFAHDHAVYLEITESVPLSHFVLCQSVLREVRSKGVYLVVDDFGAGYSNLKYISDLTPEIVKLDRELIQHLDQDPRRQQLVKNIVQLCVDMGAEVVAEGVETRDEAQAARDAGAHYAQGWYFARPACPPPEVPDSEPGRSRPVARNHRT